MSRSLCGEKIGVGFRLTWETTGSRRTLNQIRTLITKVLEMGPLRFSKCDICKTFPAEKGTFHKGALFSWKGALFSWKCHVNVTLIHLS